MKTQFKDRREEIICLKDLVSVNGKVGFIWKYDNEILIAWDIEGPSNEDSQNLEELLNDKYNYIVVVGTQK